MVSPPRTRHSDAWGATIGLLLALVMGLGSLASNLKLFSTYTIPIAILVAIIMAGLAIFPVFDRFPNILKPWIEKWRDRIFLRHAARSGRADLLERYNIDWELLETIDAHQQGLDARENLFD